jgi:chromosome segregation ATPase
MNQLEQDLIIEQMDLDLEGKATLQGGGQALKSSWKFDKGLALQADTQQSDKNQDRGAGFEEAVDDIDSMREDFRNFNLHCNDINENLSKLAQSKKSKSITAAMETFRAFVSDFRKLDIRLAANSKEFKGHLRSTEMYKTKVNNLELEIRKQVDMAAQIQEDNLFFIEQINRLESAEQDQQDIFRDYDDKERKIQKELDQRTQDDIKATREWEVKLADEQRKVLNLEREIANKRTEVVYLEQKSKNLQIVHEIQKTDNTQNVKDLEKLETLESTFNALKTDFENVSSERDRFLAEMKMLEDKHTLLWDDFHKETSLTSGLKRENGALNNRVQDLENAALERRRELASVRNSAMGYELPTGFALTRQNSVMAGGNPMFSHMGTQQFKESVRSRMDKTSMAYGGWQSNKGSVMSRLPPNFQVTPTVVKDSIGMMRPPLPKAGQFKSSVAGNICMRVEEDFGE